MSVKKFGKNRSVDRRYYNVPYKYLTSIEGQHEATNMERKMTLAEYKKMRQELCERWAEFGEEMPSDEEVKADYKALSKQARKNDEDGSLAYSMLKYRKPKELIKSKDKTLCIVDFFGNKYALVGWRNNSSCSISMPKLYKLIKKNGKYYVKYKDKLIKISGGSGWVI